MSLLMDDNLSAQVMIPETTEGQTVLEGWLIKKGSVVKNLKRRYFILARGQMDYYEDLDNEQGNFLKLQKKGSFPLVNCSAIYNNETHIRVNNIKDIKAKSGGLMKMMSGLSVGKKDKIEETPWGFTVRCYEDVARCLTLYAPTQSDMEEWLKAIRRCIVFNDESTKYWRSRKEGFLIKSTVSDPTRKLRYAALWLGSIRYFEDSQFEEVKQSVSLEDIRCGMVDGSEKSIFISCKSGTWQFEAESTYDAAEWLKSIISCAHYTNKWREIQKEGWLVKMGHKNATLTRRWFVLHNGDLFYYTDESLSSKLGGLPLMADTVIEDMKDDDGGFHFTVKSNGKDIILTAPTGLKRDEWIAAVNDSSLAEKK